MTTPISSPAAQGSTPAAPRRKLIEVSLPLEDINRESIREKEPFTRNHPRSIHIWWARRPHAAARAVLFAQLVDDPSSNPDRFPTQQQQQLERHRLHNIIRRLVVWENANDGNLLAEANAEIMASTGGNPPAILDPFAGGGTIPVEAQRLGLEARASDLNPVAVLINKALIEIPPKFTAQEPVFPGVAARHVGEWPRTTGLAEDLRQYGAWMREQAEERLAHIYPKATVVDGSTGGATEANVTAWIWARTVSCPNPACGIRMPLVRSWWLSKKKGRNAYVIPQIEVNEDDSPKASVTYSIGYTEGGGPDSKNDGTVSRSGAKCVRCAASVDFKYIRAEASEGRIGSDLLAMVAEGPRSRIYLGPDERHAKIAVTGRPSGVPETNLPAQALGFRVQAYGMSRHSDLFTDRQLTALTTFEEITREVRCKVRSDSLDSGMSPGLPLCQGGSGANAYADAVATYLAMTVSRGTDLHNALCSWNSTNENVRALFSRQAIPMVWDFPELNPLGSIGLLATLRGTVGALASSRSSGREATAVSADASQVDFSAGLISTDPPYYDNIGYSDLSDFFYVWLRRSLGDIFPHLFSTMLVPKMEELVANPYRHHGKEGASKFFETGFENVFTRASAAANKDYPITVYYAFKQQELESEGVTSTGWASLLEGMIRGGWTITATWPVRTERSSRMVGRGANALASSIVLSLRPRPQSARPATRRSFLAALKDELPEALASMFHRAGGRGRSASLPVFSC